MVAALAVLISACGSSTTSKGPTSNHDGTYKIGVYTDVGDCAGDQYEMNITIKSGVVVDSVWGNNPVSGMVHGDNFEGFIDLGDNQTVDLEGKFTNILSGDWVNEGGKCFGYFEEISRN